MIRTLSGHLRCGRRGVKSRDDVTRSADLTGIGVRRRRGKRGPDQVAGQFDCSRTSEDEPSDTQEDFDVGRRNDYIHRKTLLIQMSKLTIEIK